MMPVAVKFQGFESDLSKRDSIRNRIFDLLLLEDLKNRQSIHEIPFGIELFCRKWKIIRLEQFGSILRDDFDYASDIDFLVTFDPSAKWSLLDMAAMEQELEALFGRRVDLIERQVIEQSDNWIRRKEILGTAEDYYVA
jgi:hypothetical protein